MGVTGAVLMTLGGCATRGTTELAVAPEKYAAMFDAARHVLREARFDLERVDAGGGVITTAAKRTAGLATPWDAEQQSAGQELEDLLQHQQRRVRITFEPAQAESSEPFSLTEQPAPTTMRVRVVIERINRPNWRVDSTSIRLSHYAWDPALAEREMQPRYEVAIADDAELAMRLVQLIRARAGQ